MKKSILMLLIGGAVVFMSFKVNEKLQNKPQKIYRQGNSKIIVWENKSSDNKTWLNYQVEKEYEKNGETKYTKNFNEKELLDLKVALDKAIAELEKK